MVIVNTVVIVQALLGRPQHERRPCPWTLGAGSMAAALVLPRVLDRLSDRGVMLPSAAFLGVVLVGVAALTWCGAIGWPYCRDLARPWDRLLRRPVRALARVVAPHLPLAGCLGAAVGMPATMAALGALTVAGVAAAAMLWPASDPDVVAHAHADLDRPTTPRAGDRSGPARACFRHRRPASAMAVQGELGTTRRALERRRSGGGVGCRTSLIRWSVGGREDCVAAGPHRGEHGMRTLLGSWQLWALLSAAFAALTAIFAKVGIENVNSDFATFIRTVVILCALGAILVGTVQWVPVGSVSARTYVFLVLSGLATGRLMDLLLPRPQARRGQPRGPGRQAQRRAGGRLRVRLPRRTSISTELARRRPHRRRGRARRLSRMKPAGRDASRRSPGEGSKPDGPTDARAVDRGRPDDRRRAVERPLGRGLFRRLGPRRRRGEDGPAQRRPRARAARPRPAGRGRTSGASIRPGGRDRHVGAHHHGAGRPRKPRRRPRPRGGRLPGQAVRDARAARQDAGHPAPSGRRASARLVAAETELDTESHVLSHAGTVAVLSAREYASCTP